VLPPMITVAPPSNRSGNSNDRYVRSDTAVVPP